MYTYITLSSVWTVTRIERERERKSKGCSSIKIRILILFGRGEEDGGGSSSFVWRRCLMEPLYFCPSLLCVYPLWPPPLSRSSWTPSQKDRFFFLPCCWPYRVFKWRWAICESSCRPTHHRPSHNTPKTDSAVQHWRIRASVISKYKSITIPPATSHYIIYPGVYIYKFYSTITQPMTYQFSLYVCVSSLAMLLCLFGYCSVCHHSPQKSQGLGSIINTLFYLCVYILLLLMTLPVWWVYT